MSRTFFGWAGSGGAASPLAQASSPIYYGKLPSRGDFVRSSQHAPLIQSLDPWLSQAMQQLATDPAWKQAFDATAATPFAFLGTRNHAGLAGHLLPSQDSSGRRFPFLLATSFTIQHPLGFLACAPLALNQTWTRLESLAAQARGAADFGELQEPLGAPLPLPETDPRLFHALFTEFLDLQTLDSLESALQPAAVQPASAPGSPGLSLRQSLLALGLLLQPVLAQGVTRLEKGLVLPLPPDPTIRPFVATFWLDLVAPFLRRADFELAIFLVRWDVRPALLIGFSGAEPATLHSLFDARQAAQDNVLLADADWAEAHAEQDWGMRKLSTYLREPQLSLRQAVATFREVFLGA